MLRAMIVAVEAICGGDVLERREAVTGQGTGCQTRKVPRWDNGLERQGGVEQEAERKEGLLREVRSQSCRLGWE